MFDEVEIRADFHLQFFYFPIEFDQFPVSSEAADNISI